MASSPYFLRQYRNFDSNDTTLVDEVGPPPVVVKSIQELGWSAPSGKVFKEWNSSQNGGGTVYQIGDTISTKGTNAYAIWEDIIMPNSYKKLIDFDLLSYFKSKLDLLFANKVDKVDGKGLSSNDYTSNEKTKLAGIAAGAQVNVLEGIQVTGTTISLTNKIANIPAVTTSADGVMTASDKTKLNGIATGAQVNVIETVKRNGTALTVTGKAVDITVPTKTSDLTNDSNFGTYTKPAGGIPASDLASAVQAGLENEIASFAVTVDVNTKAVTPGTGVTISAIRAAITNGKTVRLIANDGYVFDLVSDGELDLYFSCPMAESVEQIRAYQNFNHTDAWAFSGNIIPTKTSDIQNDSGFITISDVPEGAIASSTTPKMNAATAVVGTETAFARGDHVHPSDSTKVDKVSGKGLSTEDYTTAEKTKLSGIATGAQVNVVTDASSTGSGASQTMTVNKGNTSYTTYTKAALDTSLGAKANASSVYTKTEIDQKLSGAMNYKGTKATTDALPASGNAQGDVWHVTADGSEWAWNGSAWEELGTAIDLSGYVEDDDLGLATTAQIDGLFT